MTRQKMLWSFILSQIVYVLFIAVWLFIAGFSVMMFDDPSAMSDTKTWLIFSYIVAYPLGLLAALIGGWVLFARTRYKAALIWNAIPLIWIVPMLGFLVYSQF
ncbi:hypothetical protein BC351_22225 [Paenibacillus ferrarius]|uniref:Uncharacterized protein n=1 Tax=Paenibacillus ferrarius TaxID=1469647 RepID=A0A1V4HN59_9BACL|nr:hypothetical protein [Paenibacillus ferrarius]OPH59046.1 hypothetical protein BC351_22225 [Paenibacillus ferrarius]